MSENVFKKAMSSEGKYNRNNEKEVKNTTTFKPTASHLQNLNRAVSLVALMRAGHYEPRELVEVVRPHLRNL